MTLDFQRIEDAVGKARGSGGGAEGEFEALQDVISALSIRSRVMDAHDIDKEFYAWYLSRLVLLEKEILKDLDPIPYQLRYHRNLTLWRVRAILYTLLPELGVTIEENRG